MARLGILISGRGSNMMAIAHAIETQALNATIAIVVSNNGNAPGLEWAKTKNIKTVVSSDQEQIAQQLKNEGVDWVILAGFMRILSKSFIRHFENRILNIHPSLLPKYKGLNAQEQALKAGETMSGCTVHFVVEELDSGPIILQKQVPIYSSDTVEKLSDRILVQEHLVYPEAIKQVIKGVPT